MAVYSFVLTCQIKCTANITKFTVIIVITEGAYPLLKGIPLLNRQSVSFSYDWYNIDTVVQTFHELNIQRTQTKQAKGENMNMSRVVTMIRNRLGANSTYLCPVGGMK